MHFLHEVLRGAVAPSVKALYKLSAIFYRFQGQ